VTARDRPDWQKAQAERFGSDARTPAYEPAVDKDGEALWLTPGGEVWWKPDDGPDPSDPGWRRLYVEREPDNPNGGG
jgi:hypothetical protein